MLQNLLPDARRENSPSERICWALDEQRLSAMSLIGGRGVLQPCTSHTRRRCTWSAGFRCKSGNFHSHIVVCALCSQKFWGFIDFLFRLFNDIFQLFFILFIKSRIIARCLATMLSSSDMKFWDLLICYFPFFLRWHFHSVFRVFFSVLVQCNFSSALV